MRGRIAPRLRGRMTTEGARHVEDRSDATASGAIRARRDDGARAWIENRPPRSWWPRLDLGELWSSREIAYFLALRNVKTRYKQTFFGAAWAVLQPLAGVAIFSVVFGRLARVPSEGIPYPVFVFAGLVLWLYFANAASAATDSLAGYRNLVTKVYFPRLLAPLAAVLPGLIDLAVALVAVAAFMAIYGVAPTPAILLLPLWVLATVTFAVGVGTWLAALNVKYRDVRNALAFLVQLWFFATPVVYGSSLISGTWTFILAMNPMAGLIQGFRWSLIGGPAPGMPALISLCIGAGILAAGIAYFARAERFFADLV
jgi:lipopolysaccharide transport system permease protein